MSIRTYIENGQTFVTMPLAEYEALEDALDIQMADAIMDRVRSGDSELWPGDVVRRLVDGENPLRVIREWRDLTQSDLALKAGVTQGFLSGLEKGEKEPRIATLRAIARALDVAVDDLIGWTD